MSHDSKGAIFAAMGANFGIAVSKAGASVITGSSAMMSEAVHSLVDTGNQGLLLLGLSRAKKPADAKHPFGYGGEVYFWAFLVAIFIFALGGGIALYEGIQKIIHPHELATDPITWLGVTFPPVWINYAVLIIGILLEGGSFFVAFKAFAKIQGQRTLITAVRESKDPTLFTVLFEDSAAMAGLIIALIGVFLADYTGNPIFDGLASCVIGVILGSTALFLAIECKGLLIGEAANQDDMNKLRRIAGRHPSITTINEAKSLHVGPTDILLCLSVDFVDSITAGDVEKTVSALEVEIRSEIKNIRHVYIEAQNRKEHQYLANKHG